MSFPVLLEEILSLKIAERRARTDDYLEVVVEREHLDALCAVLGTYFGAPIKPEGQSPDGKATRLAAIYGGVREHQTMYCRQNPGHDEYALLWPWGSGSRITAKIIKAESSSAPRGGFLSFLSNLFGRKA